MRNSPMLQLDASPATADVLRDQAGIASTWHETRENQTIAQNGNDAGGARKKIPGFASADSG